MKRGFVSFLKLSFPDNATSLGSSRIVARRYVALDLYTLLPAIVETHLSCFLLLVHYNYIEFLSKVNK